MFLPESFSDFHSIIMIIVQNQLMIVEIESDLSVNYFQNYLSVPGEEFCLSTGGKNQKYPWFEFFPPEEKIKVG